MLLAFSRSMILAPQLHGSPWFLRADEYPQLAYEEIPGKNLDPSGSVNVTIDR